MISKSICIFGNNSALYFEKALSTQYWWNAGNERFFIEQEAEDKLNVSESITRDCV